MSPREMATFSVCHILCITLYDLLLSDHVLPSLLPGAVAQSDGDGDSSSGPPASADEPPSVSNNYILAHGILMSVMFIIFLPLGAIYLRKPKSSGSTVRHHGIWQTLSALGVFAGFGIGAWIATTQDQVSNLSPIPVPDISRTMWYRDME